MACAMLYAAKTYWKIDGNTDYTLISYNDIVCFFCMGCFDFSLSIL